MIENRRDDLMSEARRPTKVKKAFSEHLNALMLSTVAFLLIFMFMAAMTTITVDAELNLLEVGVQTVLMYVCTVAINIILRSYARRKGRETSRWKQAHEEIELYGRAIVSRGLIRRTSEYCREWEEHDVNSVRRRILEEAGLTLADYVLCAKFSMREIRAIASSPPSESRGTDEKSAEERIAAAHYTKGQLKAIGRAKGVRRLHYDENYLSMKERIPTFRRSPSGGIKSGTMIGIQTAELLVTGTIASFYSVSLAAELIADFSFATIVMCLARIAMLVLFAIFGVIGGYKFATGREVAEMIDRADEQRRFFKWCGEEVPDLEAKAEA